LTSRALVFLSGEGTSLAEAEARALFQAYDPGSKFERPEERVLIVESGADLAAIESRIAFARRVGTLVTSAAEAGEALQGKKVRFRSFDLKARPPPDPESYLRGVDVDVDLASPDREVTVVRGKEEYVALTSPGNMRQSWSRRRPRARRFFHPAAIFPKLARAMVNLSRCLEGEVFFDPFAGTGSIPLEAGMVGAEVVAADLLGKMTAGALTNMKQFGEGWMGVVRADAFHPPLASVDAIATDIPYGRTSSTRGMAGADVMRLALAVLPSLLPSGSRFVLMHPKHLAAEVPPEVAVEEEHDLYVHKLLTRTITVLRRR
jgi:16S rRNA G966 N2-methylase RsmD